MARTLRALDSGNAQKRLTHGSATTCRSGLGWDLYFYAPGGNRNCLGGSFHSLAMSVPVRVALVALGCSGLCRGGFNLVHCGDRGCKGNCATSIEPRSLEHAGIGSRGGTHGLAIRHVAFRGARRCLVRVVPCEASGSRDSKRYLIRIYGLLPQEGDLIGVLVSRVWACSHISGICSGRVEARAAMESASAHRQSLQSDMANHAIRVIGVKRCG
jgi:hypothetical protein